MARFHFGQEIVFKSKAGRRFKAVVNNPRISQGKITAVVAGDPFAVPIAVSQIEDCKSLPSDATVKVVRKSTKGEAMPTATTAKPGAARRLAKEAKMLGIKGFASMSGPDLKAAVEAAKNGTKPAPAKVASKPAATKKAVRRAPAKPKAVARPAKAAVATKKAPPKKVAAKKAAPAKRAAVTGDNPFREGSNSFIMAAELLKGGNRGEMVKRLKKAMKIHPWSKPKEENPEFAIRKRMLLVAAALEKDFGFTIVREGRGEAGTMIAVPPGKKVAGQKATSRASSAAKKTPAKKAPARKR